jgi:hypothetical protein
LKDVEGRKEEAAYVIEATDFDYRTSALPG